ncbi:putative X-Pro dipeptidyl-peptidase [Hyaloscypha sp. PMI_1271]|nr:putative X-Pro dipeptidyl-peptidase [Hyaloscypha sp. PMI_1271]
MRQSIGDSHEDWERIDDDKERESPTSSGQQYHGTMRERIDRVSEDLKDLQAFYNIEIPGTRKARLREYLEEALADLRETSFRTYDQQGKIDFLLLQNFLRKGLKQLELGAKKDEQMEPLIPFAGTIAKLCEDRQMMKPVDGEMAANHVFQVSKQIAKVKIEVTEGKAKVDKTSAFRAANSVERLRWQLAEWFGFFKGFDPMFTWWVAEPYAKVDKELVDFAALVRKELVGIKPGDEDVIVGEPIGRHGLLADLESEMIPYSPEELIQIGEKEYTWCESEMKKASRELGYGDEWRDALEHVKNLYVGPGKQPQLIHFLAREAIDYVKKHDLVTVPRIAEETWRMFMMSPARQKVNPFFLGGKSIIVSYPDDTMDHEAKMMSMRGNNIHFSRSTVFHEMIPGHHLQFHMFARYKPYRQMFDTPFWIEGWALYWEMILWDRGFPSTPENKIGMLFWRMHRCARIIFSIKFHLGQMTPQECIDMLVDMVGHERATAEGEVRRSFNGDYSPLYQAGYMLGALQIYSLRKEQVNSGKMGEKQFHDRVLRENMMPIEFLRALMEEKDVGPDFKSSWRFYEGHEQRDDFSS